MRANWVTIFWYCLLLLHSGVKGQVSVFINANESRVPVSPYIYGKNNSFSATNPGMSISAAEITRNRDAGVRFFRESGGNNSTKYNWRKKLSSHPDWYNNVYTNDWDAQVTALQAHFPEAQGMWAFQLIGKVAKTNQHNFDEWSYNQSQWWDGVQQNLAGGGTVNPAGGRNALVNGNPDLYLQDWPADSSVAILKHWFEDLALQKDKLQYWNMDNEPEIWSGSHDDVMPVQPDANDFIDRYVETALKARQYFPDIRLVGPVVANEWQWYNWNNGTIQHEGRRYCWMEFFIKRIAEEELRHGQRLLDVVDVHFYPYTTSPQQILQLHRVFFDRSFDFPEANGVRNVSGSWEGSQKKEYILGRISDWLNQYKGEGHGVKLGVTEAGLAGSVQPGVAAVWHASNMGELMRNGVELFSPWYWYTGMWETLNLFSNYNQSISVHATSTDEEMVSAYPSINPPGDSMTVVLVNRSLNQAREATVQLSGFVASDTQAELRTINDLPAQETFFSAVSNALKREQITISPGSFQVTLPPLSVVSVTLRGSSENPPLNTASQADFDVHVYPDPATGEIMASWHLSVFDRLMIVDSEGRVRYQQTIDSESGRVAIKCALPAGQYRVYLSGAGQLKSRPLVIR